MKRMKSFVLLVSVLVFVVACATTPQVTPLPYGIKATPPTPNLPNDSNDSVVGGKGSPPEIVNVYFEPREPTLTDSVYLVINYKDPDGDVVNANLYYTITAPGGHMRVVYDGLLSKPETAGLIEGQKEGLAKIFLGPKWYGKPTLVVRLYLVDVKGNKSAAIKREVNILPPPKK